MKIKTIICLKAMTGYVVKYSIKRHSIGSVLSVTKQNLSVKGLDLNLVLSHDSWLRNAQYVTILKISSTKAISKRITYNFQQYNGLYFAVGFKSEWGDVELQANIPKSYEKNVNHKAHFEIRGKSL